MPSLSSGDKMADILYVLAFAFIFPFVSASNYCDTYSWFGPSSEYCYYGCCDDYDHSGYKKCCESYYDADHVIAVGTIVGIVIGCVILVVTIVSVIICCVCCMRKSRGTQGQTVTMAASGPYVMNQTTYGAQVGQPPYGQQQYPGQPTYGQQPYGQPYPAQPPLQTGNMAPGTTVVNSPGMQGPPPYEKGVDN